MSSVSHTGENCMGWAAPNLIQRLIKSWEGFFRNTDITGKARIYHGIFSYSLIPNTSIKNFYNMSPVTCIDSGDFYVCIFDQENYQGIYQLLSPGEKAQISQCSSVIVGAQKFSIDTVRRNASPPQGYWEMDGPMYVAHFSSGYRYA